RTRPLSRRDVMRSRSPLRVLVILVVLALAAGLVRAARAPPLLARGLTRVPTPPGGAGGGASLGLAGAGRAQVAPFDAKRGALLYSEQTFGGWRTEIVAESDGARWYASLALGPGGEPAIASYDVGRGVLTLASRSRGEWTSEVVDATRGA